MTIGKRQKFSQPAKTSARLPKFATTYLDVRYGHAMLRSAEQRLPNVFCIAEGISEKAAASHARVAWVQKTALTEKTDAGPTTSGILTHLARSGRLSDDVHFSAIQDE